MEIHRIKIRPSAGDRCRLASDLFRGIGSSHAVPRMEARRRRDGEQLIRRRRHRPILHPEPLLLLARRCPVPGRNIRGVGFVPQCHPNGEYRECPASVAPDTRRGGGARWRSTGEERVHLFPSGHVSTELERFEGDEYAREKRLRADDKPD
ncbi:PREDICTED: uncharacterized protein LOC105566434 [Vollenhovia emeryi]|uniref:uncharacterized protein LOC105566434 n=1 Tax=Vollenhovia emeryi TaxID=411798 RepID=UPI0005F4E4DD|nr:PREDICTED: uncharacterized protein LOC105566434 [Vollenhovia emeryi]